MYRTGVEGHWNERGVLERYVHFEDVIGRSQDHLLFVRDDHCLQHIDHLCDVSAAYAIGMASEDVKVQGREDGVAQAVLLDQKSWIAARKWRVPASPFVNKERYLLVGVILVHDRRVLADETFHLQSGFENLAVLSFTKSYRRIEKRQCPTV